MLCTRVVDAVLSDILSVEERLNGAVHLNPDRRRKSLVSAEIGDQDSRGRGSIESAQMKVTLVHFNMSREIKSTRFNFG